MESRCSKIEWKQVLVALAYRPTTASTRMLQPSRLLRKRYAKKTRVDEMRQIIPIAVLLLSSVALAEPILDEVLTLESGSEELVNIKTNVPVSVEIELVAANLNEAMKCTSCLHLSHKLRNGHIAQKNSSSIGVGFIRVVPEEGQVLVVVGHNHPSTQKIRVLVKPVD